MNLLKDSRGTTMIELIVVIAVAGFLAFMAGVGVVIFFAKWEELNLYSDLQIDAFNTVYKMKHGINVEGDYGADFMGIASADSISFTNQSGSGGNTFSRIRCFQSTGEALHTFDYVDFWWDAWEGNIKTYYRYVDTPPRPIVLFPIEHKDDIRVTRLTFSRAGSSHVVKIVLEAQITIGEDKVRKVKFTTRVANDIT
ncbi:MAG: hypothetical protein K8R90_09000 [Candidatus Cloacimonetes bacterium]|nr:hypothetical protein [Candidatus Cloacimonadota bacterium]